MTGFTPSPDSQGDIDLLWYRLLLSEASSCDCRPHQGVYCPEGDGLIRLYDRAIRLNHQYGDRLSVNISVFTLSVHWGLDRPSTLLALLNKPWELASPVQSGTRIR
jgi:hypothetical protein